MYIHYTKPFYLPPKVLLPYIFFHHILNTIFKYKLSNEYNYAYIIKKSIFDVYFPKYSQNIFIILYMRNFYNINIQWIFFKCTKIFQMSLLQNYEYVWNTEHFSNSWTFYEFMKFFKLLNMSKFVEKFDFCLFQIWPKKTDGFFLK